jgi:hypothetical protein
VVVFGVAVASFPGSMLLLAWRTVVSVGRDMIVSLSTNAVELIFSETETKVTKSVYTPLFVGPEVAEVAIKVEVAPGVKLVTVSAVTAMVDRIEVMTVPVDVDETVKNVVVPTKLLVAVCASKDAGL